MVNRSRRKLAWALYATCAMTFFVTALASNPGYAQDLAIPHCAQNPDTPANAVVVRGFPKQRLYIYRKSPLLCTDKGAGSCAPSAYVIAGDQLLAGTDCDGWSYVTYQSTRATSGWVLSVALGDATNSGRPLVASSGLGATILDVQKSVAAGKGGPACEAARQLLNEYLKDQKKGPLGPLPTALQNRTSTQHLPSGDGTAWDGNTWDVRIDKHDLKAVTYRSGGTCSDDNLELWDSSLTHRYPISGSNADGSTDDSGYTSEDIVMLAGRPYFAHYSRSSDVTLSGFNPSFASEEICTISQVSAPMGVTRTNRDPALSNAILHGEISGAPIYDIQPYDVAPEAFGFGKQSDKIFPGFGQYTIVARGQLDIDNDGMVENIGMLHFEDGNDSAGCGNDVDTWVPVELNGDGMPVPGSQFNMKMIQQAEPGVDARLFQYKGKTYLETRTHSDADGMPSDTIWQLSAQGREMLIDFVPVHYEITSQ